MDAAPVTVVVHDAVVAASASVLPRMASFSFDYGKVHWTVLDSNVYTDCESPVMKAWLEADRKAARSAAWRIVALHHPLFQSSRSHADDQWMRPISPILERYGVDLVLTAHVHNYQRTASLRFKPTRVGPRGKAVRATSSWTSPSTGRPRPAPRAVSTSSRAPEAPSSTTDARATWQPWTHAFISDQHSFTVLDVDGKTLRLWQLDAEGRELDAVTLTK